MPQQALLVLRDQVDLPGRAPRGERRERLVAGRRVERERLECRGLADDVIAEEVEDPRVERGIGERAGQ